MTNENLCIAIQGGDKSLLPTLWDNVRGICFKLSGEYYHRNLDAFSTCGCEYWDVKQQSYLGFMQAVKSYRADTGLKFTSYLNYPIINSLRELLGIRNGTPNHKPLDNCASLDIPVNDTTNGDTPLTLGDMVEDETAADMLDNVLDCISDEHDKAVISACLDKLPKILTDVIKRYYFCGLTLVSIAEQEGVNTQTITSRHRQVLNQLRRMPEMQALGREWGLNNRLHFTSNDFSFRYYNAQRTVSELLRQQRERLLQVPAPVADSFTHI